jgi:protein phosphatase
MAKAGRSRVPVKLEAAGDTHIGGRTHNEDSILLRPDLNLFLLADGAGGQNAGNVASSLAITTIAHFFEQTMGSAGNKPHLDGLGLYTAARRLSAAVQEANKEILAIAKSSDKHRGMGTTIVAALFELEHRIMHLAYVGDSRCYRLREGRLEQLTHDHSLINDVLELRPNISDERVKKLPQNVITRALGMMENLRVSVRTHDVAHGDRYLLCSDGLSDIVDDSQIHESLALDIGCDEQVELLTSMALEAGTRDNVASIIVDCALPHASQRPKASTKPIKKKSRPKLPRIDLSSAESSAGITEESVPEIVLYDRPESRDSSPLIHVVPAASRPNVVEALQGVIVEEDQVTQEYESPVAAMSAPDPTGGEPPLRKPTAKSEGAAPREGATKIMTTDHEKLRRAAKTSMPDPTGEEPLDTPTKIVSGKGTKKTKAKAKTKPKLKGAKRGALATPGMGTMREPQKTLPGRTTADGTERGGAAARAGADKRVSAPRRNKPNVSTEDEKVRTGDTESPPRRSEPTPPDSTPPGPSEHPPAKKPPPLPTLPDGRRSTLTGPAPPSKKVEVDGAPDDDGLPLPPVRESFDTSDFTNDSVPCHACGSIIMRSADLCMYCGAPTGFVVSDKKKKAKKKKTKK